MALRGAFPIFRMAGIQVYLHFTWFIVGALEITRFAHRYHNPTWAILEYLTLFVIVLMHEFGHAFAWPMMKRIFRECGSPRSPSHPASHRFRRRCAIE
jgi:Zn-dependent protease